ncbi:MAG TPA: glycosyltransferase family 2 protein [candidate division Zixibacteria bacterium]|nr:glycosyltransferase family 2 protein [candidate division Zixibacteria bacterium]
MKPVSVVVISRDEERNIGRCLESVGWADDIVLIDSQSQDRTVEIAQEHGARIFSPVWRGYGAAKQEGVRQARCDWILSLDADEVVTPELTEEIKHVLSEEDPASGYYLPRRTQFLGRWIKHCGWYPDHILRLFDRAKGGFTDAVVHEKVVVEGRTGYLKNDLLHYSYPSLEDYFRKYNRYTTLGAEEAYRRGSRAGWFDIVIKPYVAFLKHYIARQGFRDGLEGFLVSILSSSAVMVKYAKLREIQRQKRQTGTD